MAESRYQTIKRSIADGIAAGQWRIGDILPSEHALCRDFGVSRMTVNRAMRELAEGHLIRRVPGLGSFVAEPVAQSALVEIRNIAAEIAARGGQHLARVLALGEVAAGADAAAFRSERVFHSRVLHLENGVGLQVENRLVNPAVAPRYLDQDFSRTTPNEYLTSVAPIERGEHRVQAIAMPSLFAGVLGVAAGGPCLLVVRRTWSRGALVALTHLYHPGPRFELVGLIS
jgi:GntR family histidine utilization transcriptional repressor